MAMKTIIRVRITAITPVVGAAGLALRAAASRIPESMAPGKTQTSMAVVSVPTMSQIQERIRLSAQAQRLACVAPIPNVRSTAASAPYVRGSVTKLLAGVAPPAL